jgi:hypothetical protein
VTTKPKTTKPKPKATPSIRYAELRALLGKPVDDPAVTSLLARAGKVRLGPDHVVALAAGFEIALEHPRGRKAAPTLRTLFLYCDTGGGVVKVENMLGGETTIKQPKHARFGDLPPPFDVATREDLLAASPPPDVTWKIGPGKVAVDTAGVSHDTWVRDGFELSAHYTEAGALSRMTTTCTVE